MTARFVVLSAALMSVVQAAELKQVTLGAWDQYIQSADAAMQGRLRAGASFLWADESADRRAQLRAGEILVVPVGEHNPKKVPSGLIHHWMGAAFIPNATLADVLGVIRDYTHYKDYYNPTVVESKMIRQTPDSDRFSTLLINKALFARMAFSSVCESSYVHAAPRRWYSVATTIRVQEIDDYGKASEHKLPTDEGSGYIWRLHSITRYEERDGGVYLEVEAMALSREIPAALHLVVDPVVRRISKGSLMTTLRQTQDAVSSPGQVAAREPVTPTLASGFVRSASGH